MCLSHHPQAPCCRPAGPLSPSWGGGGACTQPRPGRCVPPHLRCAPPCMPARTCPHLIQMIHFYVCGGWGALSRALATASHQGDSLCARTGSVQDDGIAQHTHTRMHMRSALAYTQTHVPWHGPPVPADTLDAVMAQRTGVPSQLCSGSKAHNWNYIRCDEWAGCKATGHSSTGHMVVLDSTVSCLGGHTVVWCQARRKEKRMEMGGLLARMTSRG